jgi:hypothetical protein
LEVCTFRVKSSLLKSLLLPTELRERANISQARGLCKLRKTQLLAPDPGLLTCYSCLLTCYSPVKLGYSPVKLGLSLLPLLLTFECCLCRLQGLAVILLVKLCKGAGTCVL